ncbi:MAG: hypothetical protein QW046_05375 [Candidatus Micrarchaeaceae archaeon]
MQNEVNIPNNMLCCPLESFDRLFFSLVDYHNTFFTSNDPEKIIEFYNHFKTRDELIKWMKERPKGALHIHEVEGNKNIIVVIPTADYNGKYAKECRENIFKGLHIIFVESGKGNFYFNYAHNCNVGIKRAMEYNPKWVVISNDDVYKIDEITVLLRELQILDPTSTDVVLALSSIYHSSPGFLGSPNFAYKVAITIRGTIWRKIYHIMKKFNSQIYFTFADNRLLSHFLYIKHQEVIVIGHFTILSGKYVIDKKGDIFDETYINSFEDIDLSLKFYNSGRFAFIDFKIGHFIGSTLRRNKERHLRNIASASYFNYKIESGKLNLKPNFTKIK